MLTDVQTLQDHTERIVDIVNYIHKHIGEPLDRETLASIAGFSIPHFHRVFTAHVGESAISFIRRLRLERAARKLRMGAVDITEVALAAGYDTHAAFSKAFKQQFGLRPSEFRQLGCSKATQLLRKG
jgi:AraC family transcriptional regulator